MNLNCASLTEELLESELFGYEKGAFTGASAPKAGLFEIANGGTLFLDEIGELSVNLQAKLLKAVEEKKIRRIGSSIERPVDVRIIAATSQDLKQMVSERRFRADLYDRLNILNLETVPLRHQKEKIKDLFLRQLNDEAAAVGRAVPFEICDEAIVELENYTWHGNFRELLNFATRLAVECLDDTVITAEKVRWVLNERINHLVLVKNSEPQHVENEKTLNVFPSQADYLITLTFDPRTEDLDTIYLKAAAKVIQHVLTQNDGNLRRTASKMGATHSTLTRILQKYSERWEGQNLNTQRSVMKRFAVAA